MRRLFNSQIWQFFIFLLTPEDSTCDGYFRKRHIQAQFDTPTCGTLKILFWILAVLALWIVPPLLGR